MGLTTQQQALIDALAGRHITASFNGRFLNGSYSYQKANGKKGRVRIGLRFDDAATLDGPSVVKASGTYGEGFARNAFFEALRVGQGDEEALAYVNECRAAGIARSGAPQAWLEANRDRLTAEKS